MGNRSKEIRDAIRKICGIDNQGLIFFNAKIVSVDDETCTIDRNGLQFEDVRLAAVIDGNTKNLLIKPKVGSMVLVADLSEGLLRDLAVIGWSEVDSITINRGENGGLTNTPELKSQLDKLSKRVDDIISAINGAPTATPADGGAAAQTYTKGKLALIVDKEDFGDIEDTKIKH